MHIVNWVNGRLTTDPDMEELARIAIFGFLQIGLILCFGSVEFMYPVGHWMRGFACVPVVSLLVAVLEFAMRDDRLGNSTQVMLSIALTAWVVIDSSLVGHVEVQHLLGALLAMEVAVLSRLLQPSHDDVRGSLSRWGKHLYVFSEELPWLLVPIVCFFWALYEFNAPVFDLLCLMSLFALLGKIVWRDWRWTVKCLEEKHEVPTN